MSGQVLKITSPRTQRGTAKRAKYSVSKPSAAYKTTARVVHVLPCHDCFLCTQATEPSLPGFETESLRPFRSTLLKRRRPSP
jgi:hypothetical protein